VISSSGQHITFTAIASFSMSQLSQEMPEISLMWKPASRKKNKFFLSAASQSNKALAAATIFSLTWTQRAMIHS
jgi:hypothetical protein